MTNSPNAMPKVPAQVQPYFDVLGPERIVDFLLAFGGAPLYLGKTPQGRGRLEQLFGRDVAIALAERDHLLQTRVPLAKAWVASVLAMQGVSKAEIARRLHVSDVSVRKWLAPKK